MTDPIEAAIRETCKVFNRRLRKEVVFGEAFIDVPRSREDAAFAALNRALDVVLDFHTGSLHSFASTVLEEAAKEAHAAVEMDCYVREAGTAKRVAARVRALKSQEPAKP